MKISKSFLWIFLVFLFSFCYVFLFLAIFPETLFITDYNIYSDIFAGDSEDTGFYPLYIALKEFFRLVGFEYTYFQYFSGTIFVFSNILFFNYIYKKLYRGLALENMLAFGFVFLSFPFIKSFSLVKSFVSLSILLLVFLVIQFNSLPRFAHFALPLFPPLMSPLALPFSSLMYASTLRKLRYSILSFFSRLSLPRFAAPVFIRLRLHLNPLFLVLSSIGLFCFAFYLILRSPIFSGLDFFESIFSVYDLFAHKIDSYFPAVNWLFIFLSILSFFVALPTSVSLLSIVLAYSVFIGFGRVSMFLPYTFVLCSNFYPRYRLLFRFFLSAYMIFAIVKGFALIQEL